MHSLNAPPVKGLITIPLQQVVQNPMAGRPLPPPPPPGVAKGDAHNRVIDEYYWLGLNGL